MRVASLVPSATELLCAIGADDLLVARSHECDWPAAIAHVPVLTRARTSATAPDAVDGEVRKAMDEHGSLYELDTAALRAYAPDIVLVQDTCSVCSIDRPSVEAACADLDTPPTLVTVDPHSVEAIFDAILHLGEAVGRADAARRTMVDLRANWWDTQDVVNPYLDGPRTLVIEWSNPLYVAGHWTPQLIQAAGGQQTLIKAGNPSRIVNPEDLLAEQVERLVIAPCGVPLHQAQPHIDALRATPWWPLLPAVQEGHVVVVDGVSSFSRPGPRLFQTHQWLTGWLQDRPAMVPAEVSWAHVPSS